jgi:hypothetical protein
MVSHIFIANTMYIFGKNNPFNRKEKKNTQRNAKFQITIAFE